MRDWGHKLVRRRDAIDWRPLCEGDRVISVQSGRMGTVLDAWPRLRWDDGEILDLYGARSTCADLRVVAFRGKGPW